jgi:nucleotide-binding universal stress UspA family protein
MTPSQVTNCVSFKNVLVATDFSEVSRSALHSAAAIARAHQGQIFIAHVMEPIQPGRPWLVHKPSSLDPGHAAVEYRMQVFAGEECLAQIPHTEIVERGETCERISELIDREHIDLLVLGTHARAGMRKLRLGSVTEELFRLVSCPVMTVGPEAGDEPRRFGQILFATDFGPASHAALPYAVTLANENSAGLTLLHVIPFLPPLSVGAGWYPGADPDQMLERDSRQAQDKLRALVPSDELRTGKPELAVVFDDVPAGILKAAAAHHADLIVMGVKASSIGGAWTSAHLPWATAHEVVGHASCPVITVRA